MASIITGGCKNGQKSREKRKFWQKLAKIAPNKRFFGGQKFQKLQSSSRLLDTPEYVIISTLFHLICAASNLCSLAKEHKLDAHKLDGAQIKWHKI